MTTTRVLIKYNGNRLVGTFDVDGRPRYITVDIKPPNQPFNCNSATLTYIDPAQLEGPCKWTGTAGRDDLQMDFGGGVSIAGALAVPRAAIRIRGAGTWSKFELPLSSIPANESQGNGINDPANQSPLFESVPDSAKLLREKQLLESGFPIIAYETVCVFLSHSSLAHL